jgi:hypothetical protein
VEWLLFYFIACACSLEHPSTIVQHSRCQGPLSPARKLVMNKQPKTKNELQQLITAKLRSFADCEEARGVIVSPIIADRSGATWTVSY